MKPKSPEDEGENEVGYGKPPKHSRFKKGQSGNPKGRPKKKKSTKDLLGEIWASEVKVNGKLMSKQELFLHQLVNDGIKGKASARQLLMSQLPEPDDELEDFEPSIDDELEALKAGYRIAKQRNIQTEEER